jgi:hypothetical protein
MKKSIWVYFFLGLMIVQSALGYVGPATAHYKFENSSTDSAGYYHLIDTGSGNAISSTSKLGGYSADFSGSGGKRALYSSTLSEEDYPLAFSAWVKWDTTPTNDWRIIAEYGRDSANCGTDGGTGISLAYDGGTTDAFRLFSTCGDSATYPFSITVGEWYQVTVAYDGNKIAHLYLDGVQVLNFTASPNGGSGNMKLYCNSGLPCYFAVGQTAYNANFIEDAKIDDVRFYINQSLNSTQISQIYNAGMGTSNDPICG